MWRNSSLKRSSESASFMYFGIASFLKEPSVEPHPPSGSPSFHVSSSNFHTSFSLGRILLTDMPYSNKCASQTPCHAHLMICPGIYQNAETLLMLQWRGNEITSVVTLVVFLWPVSRKMNPNIDGKTLLNGKSIQKNQLSSTSWCWETSSCTSTLTPSF